MRRLAFSALLVVLFASAAPAQRAVAVTLDDLPFAGTARASVVEASTDALLAALARHGVPASVFVNGGRAALEGDEEVGADLLRRWRDAGHRLENHSWSHPAYSRTPTAAYLEDVARGHAFVAGLLAEPGSASEQAGVAFYRAPYNDLGEGPAPRRALAEVLQRQRVRLAPYTVEHADYAFDALYQDALARGDTAEAERVGAAYLAQLDTAFAFAEALAEETFGRPVPQVFLIHANRVNAAYLGAMLGRLAARGYTFVPLEAALEDPAYGSPDGYEQKWGVSWLHRWRVGLGLPSRMRAEPELPAWVREAYEAR